MKSNLYMVYLVAVLALVMLVAPAVSAFGSITSVEVKGVEVLDNGEHISAFAGEVLPVRVTFKATQDAMDARVKVWIAGAKGDSFTSEIFDALNGSTYSRLISVEVPYDLDPSESLSLKISIESENDGEIDIKSIPLAGQRESYIVEILDVNVDSKVTAGSVVPVDVVLKNRGYHFADDNFVKVSIPALGVEESGYFGDLSDVDQPYVDNDGHDRMDKEDAVEGRVLVSIPRSAKAGIYVMNIEVGNDDSVTTMSKKIAVVGSADESMVVSPASSKTFAVGEKGSYSITLVNAGNKVQLYELLIEAPEGLSVEADEPIVAVPAGSSQTVKVIANAAKAGKYTFTVDVLADGNTVKSQTFTATVEGKSSTVAASTNTTVLLTVVLAIIFVVLLVVLIVLLTRKPEKKEGTESYY